jgi:hypothetical protein
MDRCLKTLQEQEELQLLLLVSFIQLMLLRQDYKLQEKLEDRQNNIMELQVLLRLFWLMKELLHFTKELALLG